MFEGLFEFIETTIFSLVNQIIADETNGVEQARKIAVMLVTFAQRNRGMTRVLCGDALVTEDERLQARVSQITERIETTFKQALRGAVTAGVLDPATEITPLAALLTHCVLGSWLRFAQSRWQSTPTTHIDAQMRLILG